MHGLEPVSTIDARESQSLWLQLQKWKNNNQKWKNITTIKALRARNREVQHIPWFFQIIYIIFFSSNIS
jgi:hypothetical protein